MKRTLFFFVLLSMLCLMLAFSVSAKDAYLEEIPQEWLYNGDTVTHFIVFDGNEYYNDATTINAFQLDVMDEALTKVKVSCNSTETISISKDQIGTKYLTKLVFPSTTTDGKAVTSVNLNALKGNSTYFWGRSNPSKIGAVVLPSTVTSVTDMNEAVGNLRYLDFGENSQLMNIPGWFTQNARKLTCVKNFPQNLDKIGDYAFNNCINAFHGVLYVNATTVAPSSFNNATTHLTGLVFGPKVETIGNQTFCSRTNETGLGNPQIKFVEFQCSASGLSLQAIDNDKGSFNFKPKSGNPRSPYSSLVCIILSHESDLALIENGATTIQEINANIYFDEEGGNLVATSHKKGERVDAPIYSSYYETGYVRYACPDCGKEELTPFEPFFECLGYSRTEGNGLVPSITVGYKIDMGILKSYEEFTGYTVNFGAIVVGSDTLEFAPLDEKGEINESIDATVFKIPIVSGHNYFDCKITGFNENQLDIKLMLGAYIIETKNDEVVSIAYMQKAQVENNNFEFISYNTVK